MNFIKKIFKKTDTVFKTKESRIQFHGEQSGEVETKIKELWRNSLLEFNEVEEAYLALAQFHSKKVPHPTLCIYPKCSNPEKIVEKLSKDFKNLFNSQEFLDIIFLNEKMRTDCHSKCNYFYKRSEI